MYYIQRKNVINDVFSTGVCAEYVSPRLLDKVASQLLEDILEPIELARVDACARCRSKTATRAQIFWQLCSNAEPKASEKLFEMYRGMIVLLTKKKLSWEFGRVQCVRFVYP